MINLLLLFIIYGFLGWIVEVTYVRINSGHLYNRGFLHMPFLPIYAFGAITITVSLQTFSNPLLVYILGVIVTSCLEYITSLIMERLFHTRWWDYSTYKYNINGRVCLKNSLLFGILSLIVIYGMNPLFQSVINRIDNNIQAVIVNLFISCIIIDLVYTLRGISHLPIRDIQIISGKVKAYRNGKLRNLEELVSELDEFSLHDGKIREELHTYTRKISHNLNIHTIFTAFLIMIIIGLLLGHVLILELVSVLIIIGIFLIIYNLKKS